MFEALEMAEDVGLKLQRVLDKLEKLDKIEAHLSWVSASLASIEEKVSRLDEDVQDLKQKTNRVEKKASELKESIQFNEDDISDLKKESKESKFEINDVRKQLCISQFHLRPAPPRADPRALAFFLPWMANSRGWGLLSCQTPRGGDEKRGQMPRPPSTLQHFSLLAQSNSAILSILMCDFLFQLTSSFVIALGF